MCGVVAIYELDRDSFKGKNTLEHMNSSQHHRGPDGNGIYINEYVGLGHSRLSIIDLATGQQPLVDATNTIAVTFNGEIYNFKELKRELIALGFSFNTNSDTEVIVNAWLAWNTKCVDKFNGMFAFVLWDKATRVLFAVRDRLGIKPLHWAITNKNQLVISSELKAIKRHCDIDSSINEAALEDFLTLGYVIEPKSIYKSIHKIPAGHYILLNEQDKNVETTCYWDVKTFISEDNKECNNEHLQKLLNESVKKRLIADVPLGAFLSGGLDSTAIVALMSEQITTNLNTCSIGFDLSQYDESSFAERVAQEFKTQHSTTNVSVHDLSLVDLLVDVFDEPFADNSAIPTLILSKAAKESVKVVLSGDGSDELFFGYRNYKMLNMEEKIRRFFPGGINKPIFSFLGKIYPRFNSLPRFMRAKSTFNSLSSDGITSHHNSMSLADNKTITYLYSLDFISKLNGYTSLSLFQKLASEVKGLGVLKQVQYIDFKTYLPSDILTKVDRASMAGSLEARVPFLDHNLVEYGLSLAPSVNLKGRKVKAALAESLKCIVPKFVLNREKMGFTAPLDEWIRQIPLDTLEKRILSEHLLSENIFNALHLRQLLNDHHKRKKNNGVLIWAILILEAFFRKNNNKL
ncbi:asparagine synthase (glutamine-hydrolyzing) [Colwellia sp. 1_MG-2023]|jgi:asparagine synthase (glutamine-hydrolysing)|uniref:asparagine synthase (glutamine-hydrolyzing) n=1 Tax=unclassified Colwellia TaxID=196834 RepID=UPI001C086B03|nr:MULTISPECIES: asparagine synthase (glutamine-hydrolyzing) [unclassified Colwellia]MBU2924944.1 asparagine synthase (glutamine-hydrolyzing) [Colwellia sp. C2M11]MDO6652824.1 asparagine synthase (glutamine-hydrolyzing) [Colwellia sp. 3_MG-2023]MDO6665826.1 asparagine synthase (glutamine-hydrolyzing) [Colwellia sp. 2_MG-2023]MDO6690199.1 asparagine synthase (glutamine-hydrolyzing) [Colwellia sp. 1_MG-2023]